MWLNIAFGLICLPGYMYFNEWIRFFIAPILFFMILSRRAEFFPGLVIHLFAETISMYIILFSCLITTLLYWKYWFNTRLKWIFILTLLPLPILIWQTVIRYFNMNLGFIDIIIPIDYYLGLFPFFYGFLISERFNKEIFGGIVFVLLLSFFINTMGIFDNTIRIVFYAIPFLITYAVFGKSNLLSSGFQLILRIGTVIVIGIYIFFINQTTITILSSILLSILLVYLKIRKFNNLVLLLSSKWTFIFTILVVAWLAFSTNKTAVAFKSYSTGDLAGLKFTNYNDLVDRISFKTFADRAPIWRGVWLSIVSQNNILPPYKVKSYEITTLEGNKIKSEVGAHNIFLELLRKDGYFVGLIIGFTFIIQILLACSLLRLPLDDRLLISMVSSVAIVGIIGGMTGQFPLMASFSFLFIGLAGLLFGLGYFEDVNVIQNESR